MSDKTDTPTPRTYEYIEEAKAVLVVLSENSWARRLVAHARQLERELAEAKATAERNRLMCSVMESDLREATRQRDEERECLREAIALGKRDDQVTQQHIIRWRAAAGLEAGQK